MGQWGAEHGEEDCGRGKKNEPRLLRLLTEVHHFFLIFGDISVFMQPKCFKFCDGWKLLDELNVICILAIRGCIVYS
jgi:hypothetical protein